MSRTAGEALRERIAKAERDLAHHSNSEIIAREIAAAIVEELGITREDVEKARSLIHRGGYMSPYHPAAMRVLGACFALLDCAEVEP